MAQIPLMIERRTAKRKKKLSKNEKCHNTSNEWHDEDNRRNLISQAAEEFYSYSLMRIKIEDRKCVRTSTPSVLRHPTRELEVKIINCFSC
jgi:hypothetical protein